MRAASGTERNSRGFGLPGLRQRRDGSDLDETEAKAGKPAHGHGILVEAGGEAHAVREGKAHDLDRAT